MLPYFVPRLFLAAIYRVLPTDWLGPGRSLAALYKTKHRNTCPLFWCQRLAAFKDGNAGRHGGSQCGFEMRHLRGFAIGQKKRQQLFLGLLQADVR